MLQEEAPVGWGGGGRLVPGGTRTLPGGFRCGWWGAGAEGGEEAPGCSGCLGGGVCTGKGKYRGGGGVVPGRVTGRYWGGVKGHPHTRDVGVCGGWRERECVGGVCPQRAPFPPPAADTCPSRVILCCPVSVPCPSRVMAESPDWATLSPQEFAQLQKYLDCEWGGTHTPRTRVCMSTCVCVHAWGGCTGRGGVPACVCVHEEALRVCAHVWGGPTRVCVREDGMTCLCVWGGFCTRVHVGVAS